MRRSFIKAKLLYDGLPETRGTRNHVDSCRSQYPGYPYCPADEGDLLYSLARRVADHDALEVGFATGSTALYLLNGIRRSVTSIDYDQDGFDRLGCRLLESAGMGNRHTLLEANSIEVLPDLYSKRRRYGICFLDGWKTFDHLWVDVFYCSRMLIAGGFMVFDDARMTAVRRAIYILRSHHQYEVVNIYNVVGGMRNKLWHILTTRSFRKPYYALRKTREIEETPAGCQYNFYAPF